MKKQPWVSFSLAGVSLTDFGLEIPSPFSSLDLANSEIQSVTSWTLKIVVGGNDTRHINSAAFEALLYTSAQAASKYSNSSGIPVAFAFGWLNESGDVDEYLSYQGFTLQFNVSTSGIYMIYTVKGYASLLTQTSTPALRIPAISGIVQPSAVVQALCESTRATDYYDLDIDRNDNPTLVQHGAMTTSFNRYVRGVLSTEDDFDSFPGLLKLSKSYSGSRDAAGIQFPLVKTLGQVINNAIISPVSKFLRSSIVDTSPQCSSFSFWIDEPTMTAPGIIHYKSNSGLLSSQMFDTLRYGTSDTNILSINGSYNGVAYNMTDMNFSSVGFVVDGSGNTIIQNAEVVNSWSNSVAEVFQTVNIINDISAIASQFSGDFTVTIPGSVKRYTVAQPISLIIMTGNTLSPVSGIYNIISVGHTISSTFVTTLKLQRLVVSSANQTAALQNIYVSGSSSYPSNSYETTSNIKSPYKVDLGIMFPTFRDMGVAS